MRLELSPRTLKEEDYQFSGRGEVYSFTTVYEAPEDFEYLVPYNLALVRLEEGPMVTTMLTDLEEQWVEKEIDGEVRLVKEYKIEIGMPVEMVTRKIRVEGDPDTGLIIYGYKFRPPLNTRPPRP